MTTSIARWLALAAVVLLALGLRTWDLQKRPMHADEANQGVKVGELLEGRGYVFDPADHHGPTLYFLAAPAAWLRGERSLTTLSETTLRLVPALFGVFAVWLLATLVLSGDRGTTLLAATFLAVSPPAVYYARYFIQETLLVSFTLLAVFAAHRWWITGKTHWVVITGLAVGLMLATKETALLLLVAAAIGAVVARPTRPQSSRALQHALLALAVAGMVAGLFYSSFGRHPGGARDALLAPWLGLLRAAGETGHEKPWWYYLRLLTYARSGGLVFEQGVFTALSLVGVIAGFLSRSRWLRGAAVYAFVLLVAISAVPYKTPWNVIHVVPALCLLAGGGVMAIARLRTGRFVAVAFAFVALAMQLAHTRRAAFQRPADGRNPWAYVHSSPDVLKYRAIANAALASSPGQPVKVISEEYWPLPWYLRGLPQVGYWTTPPVDCDGALVIASATQAASVRERLHGPYEETFLGLRPGFVCVLFKRTSTP